MSIYVVRPEVVDKVVTKLHYDCAHKQQSWQRFDELGYALDNMPDCDKLAQDMYDMNVRAVKARYPQDTDDYPYTPMIGGLPPVLLKAYQALDEYLRQCDGAKDPLYGVLSKTLDIWAHRLVRTIPD